MSQAAMDAAKELLLQPNLLRVEDDGVLINIIPIATALDAFAQQQVKQALAEQREADARVAERIHDDWIAIMNDPDEKETARQEAADRADTADTIATAIRSQKGA